MFFHLHHTPKAGRLDLFRLPKSLGLRVSVTTRTLLIVR
nr:MAG TPA: hypothetical protein [Caudoviricetes sp.]DAY00593.1 MAG TPA: hypothetical protein [Caudoviricetes sp.]